MTRIIQTSRRRTGSGSGKALLAPAAEQTTPDQAAEPGPAASRKRKRAGRQSTGNPPNSTVSHGGKRRKVQDELPAEPTSPRLGRSERTTARETPAPQLQSVQPTLPAPRGTKRKAEGQLSTRGRATRKGTETTQNPLPPPGTRQGQEGVRDRRGPQQDEKQAQEAYRDEITNVQDDMELDLFVPDITGHAATQNLRPPGGGGGDDDPPGQGPGGGAGGGAPGGGEDSSDDDDSPPGSRPPGEEDAPGHVPDREDEDPWSESFRSEEDDHYLGELYDPGFLLCITGNPPQVGHDFGQMLQSGGDPLHQGWEIVKWLATRGNYYELHRGLPFHHEYEEGNEATFRTASVVLNSIARARRARPYCEKRDFASAATSAVTWAYHIDLPRRTLGVYGPPKLHRRDMTADHYFHESVHVIDGRAPRHIVDYSFEELRQFTSPVALHQSILHALAEQDVRRYSIPPAEDVWVLYEPVYRDVAQQESRTPSVSAVSTQEEDDDDDDDNSDGGPGPGPGGGPHSSSSPPSSPGPHTPGSPRRSPTPPIPNGHAQESPERPGGFQRSNAPSPEEIPGSPTQTPLPASSDDLNSPSGGASVANGVPVTNGHRTPSPRYPNLWEQAAMPLASEQGTPDAPPQTPVPHPRIESPGGHAEPQVNGVLGSPIHFTPRPPRHQPVSSSTEIAPGTSPPQQPVEYTESNFSPLDPGPRTPENQIVSLYEIGDRWSPGDPTPPHQRPPNSSSSPGDYASDQENLPPRSPSPQPPPRTPSPQPSLEDYVSDDEYDDANFQWPANLEHQSPLQPAPPRTPLPGTRQYIESDSRVFNEPESSTPDISREPRGDDDGSPTLGVEAAQRPRSDASQDGSPQGSLPSSPPVPRSPSPPQSPPRLPPLLPAPQPTLEGPTPAPAGQNEQLSFQDPVWNSDRYRRESSDEECVSPKSSSRPNSRAPSRQAEPFAHDDDARLPPASQKPRASPGPRPPGTGRDVDGEDGFIRLPSSNSGS
ncbi:uncharacterized protein DNG_02587 [Cephalotrichum gorgonifer]|uniref:Uncharacterized protein n=1 Tax=Cephalotrichum gorgonifer TaxID=2041049 RepID=A0AAE8MTT1_9PEZI|nr:uncharacterized protein DNG_02587 [Cephalotrichum gorgonifer]